MIKLKIIFSLTALMFLSSTAYSNDLYNSISAEASGYESSFGTEYQYDLSNPSDRVDYSIDLDAQMRDQLNIDPNIDLDRGIGEFGGGIYD